MKEEIRDISPSPPSFSSRDDVAGFIAAGVKPILPAKARITRRNTRQILEPSRRRRVWKSCSPRVQREESVENQNWAEINNKYQILLFERF